MRPSSWTRHGLALAALLLLSACASLPPNPGDPGGETPSSSQAAT
jgi:hypothetical protein